MSREPLKEKAMTNLVRFRSFLAAAALVAASTACTEKSETRREADRAARTVNDRVEDLKEESRDLTETAKDRADDVDVEDIADEAKDVGKRARQLEDANNEFKYRKMVRIGTLRAVHAVAASQPMLINAFTEAFPLEANDRGQVQEKLVIFQMRLDEAGNVIQSLELVEANDWETRDDAATKALERVEAARDDAWEALAEADRTDDRTSMR